MNKSILGLIWKYNFESKNAEEKHARFVMLRKFYLPLRKVYQNAISDDKLGKMQNAKDDLTLLSYHVLNEK